MTLYAIYARPEDGPDALAVIGEKFVWSAFLFTPLWALAKGAWAFLALWLIAAVGLWLAVPVIGADAVAALYLVLALWSGFAAPQIAARALLRRDWIASGEIAAPGRDAALALWLEKAYGARP